MQGICCIALLLNQLGHRAKFKCSMLSNLEYWSALATTPASISAQAGAKEAINFIDTFALMLICLFS
jgi:hypothetical protein